ncbi:hypothetical protein Bca4012_095019 [Brassica carinata]
MAEQPQQQRESDSSPPQLKLPSFVVNLFPFLQPKSPSPANGADGAPKPAGGVSKDKETQNSTVSFPYNPPKSTEPLKLEAEPSSGSTSNSLVIWQDYLDEQSWECCCFIASVVHVADSGATLNFEVDYSFCFAPASIVYALGGFLVLKWAWARWNERNQTSDKKEDDDADGDDQAPHPEDD